MNLDIKHVHTLCPLLLLFLPNICIGGSTLNAHRRNFLVLKAPYGNISLHTNIVKRYIVSYLCIKRQNIDSILLWAVRWKKRENSLLFCPGHREQKRLLNAYNIYMQQGGVQQCFVSAVTKCCIWLCLCVRIVIPCTSHHVKGSFLYGKNSINVQLNCKFFPLCFCLFSWNIACNKETY